VAAILLCLLQLSLSLCAARDARVSDAVRGYRWLPPLLLVAAMSAYAWLFTVLGFLIASFLFLVAGFVILGERRIIVAASVAAGLVGMLWMLLTVVFGIHLDSGEIVRLLEALGS
jgi:putative tricarboxylic transport membrane protein